MDFRKIKAVLTLLRIPNLIIIGLTLCLLYGNAEVQTLSILHLILLVVGTVCIAGGGNIINDIVDVEIDQINKKNRVVVGRLLSFKFARTMYWGSNIIAIGLAIYGQSLSLLLFFLGAIGLLYFYSTVWKRKAWIGNLVVALLCAWVVVEFWYLSYAGLTPYWHGILAAYTLFAFLSTLMRELVKDVEDLEGDRHQGCQTLAVQKGIAFVKKVLWVLLSILFLLLNAEALFLYSYRAYIALGYLLLVLMLPLAFFARQLQQANEISNFTSMSRWLKVYMLLGLFLLLLV